MLSKKWTVQEDKKLKEYYPKAPKEKLLELLPNRSWSGIHHRAERLRIKRLIVRAGTDKEQRYWTDKEVKFLIEHYPTTRNKEIGEKLNRNYLVVIRKAKEFGLKKEPSYLKKVYVERNKIRETAWTIQEEDILKKHYASMPKDRLLKLLPHRTWNTIQGKAERLGVKGRPEYYYKSLIKKFRKPKRNYDYGYFLGVLCGDASLSQNRLTLSVIDKPFADKFHKVVRRLLGMEGSRRKDGNKHVVAFGSKNIKDYFGEFKTHEWHNTILRQYDWIFNRKEYLLGFLDGFLDSEGYVGVRKGISYEIKLYSSNKPALKVLSHMLTKLKIPHKIYQESIYIGGLEACKKVSLMLKSSIPRKEEGLKYFRNLDIKPFWKKREKEVLQLYKNHSQHEIHRLTGLAFQTIRKILLNNKVKIRSDAEATLFRLKRGKEKRIVA